MLRILKVVPIVAAITLMPGLAGNASAQALFPRTYGFSCTGTNSSGTPASVVGDVRFSDWTTATGGAVFVSDSSPGVFGSFTATFVNGSANAQGVGGNGIPAGCFRGTASATPLTGFFGCYNQSTHGFDLTVTSSPVGGVLTCEGKLM